MNTYNKPKASTYNGEHCQTVFHHTRVKALIIKPLKVRAYTKPKMNTYNKPKASTYKLRHKLRIIIKLRNYNKQTKNSL